MSLTSRGDHVAAIRSRLTDGSYMAQMRGRVAFHVFSGILAASLVKLGGETRIALHELDYDT
jgi:hypothetical protein